MKWVPRLIILTTISVAVVIGLSALSWLDEKTGIFRTVKAQPVSEQNIVDVISKMQLHLRIRRVDLNYSIVSIDLLAAKTTETNDIVKDLYEIPKVFFDVSSNINQVQLRILDGGSNQEGTPQLLIATDARREKWLPGESGLHLQSTVELQQFLDTHYRMTYTPKWQDRLKEKS